MKNDKYISNLLGAFATTLSNSIEREVSILDGNSLNHESALVAIYNHPNTTINTLSKILELTHSGAVRLINTLEEKKLVKRHKSLSDARSIVLHITEAGSKRVQLILNCREKATLKTIAVLSETQKENLLNILEASMSNVTNEKLEARRICKLCNEGVCRKLICPVEHSINH